MAVDIAIPRLGTFKTDAILTEWKTSEGGRVEKGDVVADLQDPNASCPVNTGVTETGQYLYIGSLVTDFIARLPKSEAGL